MKKNLLKWNLVFAATALLAACGSDSSTGSENQPENENPVLENSSESSAPGISSETVLGEVSSSSQESFAVDPVSSSEEVASSSENAIDEPAECVESVKANITVTNMEHISMSCGSSNQGQTVYLADYQILYTCNNGVWDEELVVLCSDPDAPQTPVEEPALDYGTLVDPRDGQTYKTIVIGEQTWMAENLNYESSTSYCYQNSLDSCDKYGRLYTYNEADTVCPDGYRLPTRMDFDNLLRPLSEAVYDERLDWHYNLIELSIKATTDWVPDTTTYVNENGELVHQADATNSSGFTLLPAGYMKPNGSFSGAGKDTYLWSSADGPEAGTKYAMELEYRYDGVTFYWWELDYAFSVRCVKE